MECPALEARAPLLHLLNLHHVDSGAVSDEDKFISIMQSPDSRTAKLLYNMFFKMYIAVPLSELCMIVMNLHCPRQRLLQNPHDGGSRYETSNVLRTSTSVISRVSFTLAASRYHSRYLKGCWCWVIAF